IKIDNPAMLGADLVCGAVCALNKYPHPCIILDLGTATKFTVLAADGSLLGGAIAPGVNISLEALSSRTAQLPYIDLGESNAIYPVIGTDTIQCMRSG
ncbi:MAG: type III pantothenate kinase, partial [Oscillospiraceae bacterium]